MLTLKQSELIILRNYYTRQYSQNIIGVFFGGDLYLLN